MKDIFKKNKECVELVVRIVLDNKDLEFVEYKDQENIQNKNGKSSVLDFVIKDKDGKCYDVEIESAKGKANPSGYQRRARYYSSLLDTYYLNMSIINKLFGSKKGEIPTSQSSKIIEMYEVESKLQGLLETLFFSLVRILMLQLMLSQKINSGKIL